MGGSGQTPLLHHKDWSIGVEAVGLLLLFSNGGELHVVEQGYLSSGWHAAAAVVAVHARVSVEVHGWWGHALAVATLRLLWLLKLGQRELTLLIILSLGLGGWWVGQLHNLY